jgi:hypothetical protein
MSTARLTRSGRGDGDDFARTDAIATPQSFLFMLAYS